VQHPVAARPQNKGKKKSGEEISSTGLGWVSLHNTSIHFFVVFSTDLFLPIILCPENYRFLSNFDKKKAAPQIVVLGAAQAQSGD
jgi:hypothetical protein